MSMLLSGKAASVCTGTELPKVAIIIGNVLSKFSFLLSVLHFIIINFRCKVESIGKIESCSSAFFKISSHFATDR